MRPAEIKRRAIEERGGREDDDGERGEDRDGEEERDDDEVERGRDGEGK